MLAPPSDPYTNGSCRLWVLLSTSSRTRPSAKRTSSPGTNRLSSSAAVKGLWGVSPSSPADPPSAPDPTPAGAVEGLAKPIGRNSLGVRVTVAGELRVDGDEVICAVNFDAVAGVVDHGDIGLAGSILELPNRALELQIAGVVLGRDDVETRLLEHGHHGLGVPRGIGQGWRMLITGIADHEGDALLGESWLRAGTGADHSQR